jgi:hypothetical protein
MLCLKTGRALSETEIKKTTGKEWDNRYDKQCKGKEIEVKMTLKDGTKNNASLVICKLYCEIL